MRRSRRVVIEIVAISALATVLALGVLALFLGNVCCVDLFPPSVIARNELPDPVLVFLCDPDRDACLPRPVGGRSTAYGSFSQITLDGTFDGDVIVTDPTCREIARTH